MKKTLGLRRFFSALLLVVLVMFGTWYAATHAMQLRVALSDNLSDKILVLGALAVVLGLGIFIYFKNLKRFSRTLFGFIAGVCTVLFLEEVVERLLGVGLLLGVMIYMIVFLAVFYINVRSALAPAWLQQKVWWQNKIASSRGWRWLT